MAGAEVEEISADIAGQKFTAKSLHLNTVLTCLIGVAVGILVWKAHMHDQTTRDVGEAQVAASKEQTVAMKEQTQVMREANCIANYQGPPAERGPFCARITR